MIMYVTGNLHKVSYAKERLKLYGIDLIQKKIAIVEIQSESIEEIAMHKAREAYELIKSPLLVNDSGWDIPALSGFPGPYMSSVESWLKTEDFLRLMDGVADRRILLTEVVVYADSKQSKTFESTVEGVILDQPMGTTDFKSLDPIVSFRQDRKSLSAARREGLSVLDNDLQIWDDFAKWYQTTSY